LHLEDDWVLNRPVPVQRVLGLLTQSGVASLRLQRNPHAGVSSALSLNPVFFNSTFIAQALPHFQSDLDPEKQFSAPPLSEVLSHWKHLVVPNDSGGWVSDLGVHWRKSHGLHKVSANGRSAWEPAQVSILSLIKNKLLLASKLFFYRWRVLLYGLFSPRARP
jgi:hypothetical protein